MRPTLPWPNLQLLAAQSLMEGRAAPGQMQHTFGGLKDEPADEDREATSCNSGSETKYECTFCGKKFQTRSGVRKHMSRHTGNYLYKCDLCNKGFNEIHEYEKHLNRHKGLGYQCLKCNKSLFSMALLAKHKETCSADPAAALGSDQTPFFSGSDDVREFSNEDTFDNDHTEPSVSTALPESSAASSTDSPVFPGRPVFPGPEHETI